MVSYAYELYSLNREAVEELERMGEKSADNLLAAIEKSKECDLFRVIFSLGIRHIGQKAAKLLAERFGTMEAILNASAEDIAAIDGFGGVMAESAVRFFALPQSRHFIEQLRLAGVNMTCKTERADVRFAGMTFVLTGTLPTMKREEAAALIERHGGKTAGSVSKKTSIVLAGEDAGQQADQSPAAGYPHNQRRGIYADANKSIKDAVSPMEAGSVFLCG